MAPRGREKIRICKTNYWRRQMANGWTPERRGRQAKLIRLWRPRPGRPDRFAHGTDPGQQRRRPETRRGHADDAGPHPGRDLQQPRAAGHQRRVYGQPRPLPQARAAGAVAVPGDLGGAGNHQEPAGSGLCSPGQHRPRPAAGEQRIKRARWRPARGRKSESAKQTIGGERWRTAGPRNGVHARPS